MSLFDQFEFQDPAERDDRHALVAVDGFGTGAMGVFMAGDPESIIYDLLPLSLPLPCVCGAG